MREFKQNAVDVLYRFLPDEQAYFGYRFNDANGQLAGITGKAGAKRQAIGGGMYVTPAVLAKLEWVTQQYNGFPTTDIRNGGKFKGFMIEGVVAF